MGSMGSTRPLPPLARTTRRAARPMSTYSTVQTGPNAQLGGVHAGRGKDAYHSRSKRVVAPTVLPATTGRAARSQSQGEDCMTTM